MAKHPFKAMKTLISKKLKACLKRGEEFSVNKIRLDLAPEQFYLWCSGITFMLQQEGKVICELCIVSIEEIKGST
jgi:hypothetical protein